MGTKPFKSYEEQVSILQSRGLGIDDPGAIGANVVL